ncbi:MAG: hypothetical protein ACI9VR_002832 [Cognaticolwellia sp.]|jgi:hypothetical protein
MPSDDSADLALTEESVPVTHEPLQVQVGELVGEGQSLSFNFEFPADGAWQVEERVTSQRFGAGEQQMELSGRYELRAQAWDGGVWLRASNSELQDSSNVLAQALLAKPPDWTLSPRGRFLGVDADQDYLADMRALFPQQDPRLAQLEPTAVASSGGGYMQRNLWDKGVGVLLGQDFVVGTQRSFQAQTVLATGESLPTTILVVVLGDRDCGGELCVAVSMAEQTDPTATAELLQRNLRLGFAAANQGGVMPSVSYASVQTQRSVLLFPESGVPYSEAVLTDTRVRIHTEEGPQDTQSLEVRGRSWRAL